MDIQEIMRRALLQLVANTHRGTPKAPSGRWVSWVSFFSLARCIQCANLHGRLFDTEEILPVEPPLHDNCRCIMMCLSAYDAGTVTIFGKEGADWWLLVHGHLPDEYVTKEQAVSFGWNKF